MRLGRIDTLYISSRIYCSSIEPNASVRSQPEYYRDAPHFRRIGDGPTYCLEIPRAKLDFTGTYSVIATNCHGEAKAIISLQIQAKGELFDRNTQQLCN